LEKKAESIDLPKSNKFEMSANDRYGDIKQTYLLQKAAEKAYSRTYWIG
jgi:hypothetical protein